MCRLCLVAILFGTIGATNCSADLIFDNSVRQDFTSNRSAGSSPLAAITVVAATDINQIGAMVDLNSGGNMKFVIFDLNTSSLLFATASGAYSDDGLSFKLSPVFGPFTLNPGITYGIGAIADVGGLWGTNNSSSGNPFTMNGVTASDDRNGNVTNFSSPALSTDGGAMITVQLYSPTAEVPEPASLALWSLMSVAGLAAWRRRKLANTVA